MCSSRSCAEDMTIPNVIIKTPNRKRTGVWMTSCPEAMGWEFGDFLKKQLVEIWLWAGPVQLGPVQTVSDIGTVSIAKIVSLSPRVEKLKVKKLKNVSYLSNGELSVFRISPHLYICIVVLWLYNTCLTLSIIIYGSRVSGAVQPTNKRFNQSWTESQT